MLNSGQYNRKISLQAPTAATSAVGERTLSWTTYASPWAKFKTLSSWEKAQSQQLTAGLSHEISLLYRGSVTITPGHRAVMGDRVFDIKDVRDVDDQHVEIRLLLTESVTTTILSDSPSASPSSSASITPSASISASPSSSISASAS